MLEDSNREILQFKSYQANLNNPVAINKSSEKEKVIKQIDFKNEITKKEDNLDEDDVPIYNYPYEFYEETQSKKQEELKYEKEDFTQKSIEKPKEENKKDIIKKEEEEINVEKNKRK